MRHPSIPAGQAPSQLARRLVLGAALLIGLAFALVPRTATVHAQEPKSAAQEPKATAPAPHSQSQSASKSVTITDGRGQKIEIRKEGDAVWREYAPEAAAFTYEFKEFLRTRDEILIRNVTPREEADDWATQVVHLPVCGGMARMSEGRPEKTTDLEQVWRAPRAR